MRISEARHGQVEIPQLGKDGNSQNDNESKRKPVSKLRVSFDCQTHEGTQGLGTHDCDTPQQGADANVNENILLAERGAVGEIDKQSRRDESDEYEDDKRGANEQSGNSVCIQGGFSSGHVWPRSADKESARNAKRNAQQIPVGDILMQKDMCQNSRQDNAPSTKRCNERSRGKGESGEVANLSGGHEEGTNPPGGVLQEVESCSLWLDGLRRGGVLFVGVALVRAVLGVRVWFVWLVVFGDGFGADDGVVGAFL